MEDFYFTGEQLAEMQALPLTEKIQISVAKILQMISVTNGNIYVAYSGGKDSGVVLDMVAHTWSITRHKDKPLLVGFANTGMEYKGMIDFIKSFVRTEGEKYGIKTELITTNPSKKFRDILIEDGYPVATKITAEHVRLIRQQVEKAGLKKAEVMDHLEPNEANHKWFCDAGVSKWAATLLTAIKPDGSPCKMLELGLKRGTIKMYRREA